MNGGQLLVTFPSRSAADEYWRYVQEKMDSRQPPPYRRYHSQRYNTPKPNYDGDERDLAVACIIQEFISGSDWRSESRIVPLPVTAPDQRPDNVNGGRYYIRSTVRPNFFWFFDPSNQCIKLSSTYQTKFVIRRTIPLPFECRQEEDILIGRDHINIFAYSEMIGVVRNEKMVVKNSAGVLIAASAISRVPGQSQEEYDAAQVAASTFTFKMFDKGFDVISGISWEEGNVHVSSVPDEGDRWEFVQ